MVVVAPEHSASCSGCAVLGVQLIAFEEKLFKRLDILEAKFDARCLDSHPPQIFCNQKGDIIQEILLDPNGYASDQELDSDVELSVAGKATRAYALTAGAAQSLQLKRELHARAERAQNSHLLDGCDKHVNSKQPGVTLRDLPNGDVLVQILQQTEDRAARSSKKDHRDTDIICSECDMPVPSQAFEEHLTMHSQKGNLTAESAAMALLSFNKGESAGGAVTAHSAAAVADEAPRVALKRKVDKGKQPLDKRTYIVAKRSSSNSSSDDESPLSVVGTPRGRMKPDVSTLLPVTISVRKSTPRKDRRNQSRLPCTLCSKTYVHQGSLSRHMRQKHTEAGATSTKRSRITKEDVKGGATHAVDAIKAKGGRVARAIEQAEQASRQKRITRRGSGKSEADLKQCYLCGRFFPIAIIDNHMRGVHDVFNGPDPPPGWSRPMPVPTPEPRPPTSVENMRW